MVQPVTYKEIELQVVEVPSVINLERPFMVMSVSSSSMD